MGKDTQSSQPSTIGPSPLESRARDVMRFPSPSRVRAVREHWHRMQLGVAYWTGRGDLREADRCRRAMAWAEHELGLR
jgi:hypothetical protein